MSSIIEGYNYDIFISYRQKDNKGDHWVSEFVEALKTELESTFKEEISVYFDINPHDGLLETHDVGASLKEKLKCLIFIPIISRTYCDPKSFAWEHEFKAFVEMASKDQFGLKVKLPNGNVASRVLPIRIHELEKADLKQCENLVGGYLRGIEFIYKEAGIDKPLSADDDERKNLNKSKFRIQVIRVAHSIKELIDGMKIGDRGFNQINQNTAAEAEITGNNNTGSLKNAAENPERNRILAFLGTSALVIAAIVILYPFIFRKGKFNEIRDSEGKISIAVMPFQNLTGDTTLSYFEKGISSLITNALGNSEELAICDDPTLSEAMSDIGVINTAGISPSQARTLARRVKAESYISGSYQGMQDRYLIMANLINAETGKIIWTDKVKGNIKSSDYLEVTDSLCKKIRNYLEIKALEKEADFEFREAYPKSAESYRYFIEGMSLVLKNDYNAGINFLKKSLETDSTALAGFYLTYAYNYNNQQDSCFEILKKVYPLRKNIPLNYQRWMDMWYACYFGNSIQDIEKYCDLLSESGINTRLLWFDLGVTYHEFPRNYNKSISAFERVLEMNKESRTKWNFEMFYEKYGSSLHQLGRHKEEQEIYDLGLSVFPDDRTILRQKSACLMALGDTASANVCIKRLQAAIIKSGLPEYYIENNLGSIYSLAGFPEAAVSHFRKALEMKPGDNLFSLWLAQVMIDQNLNVNEGLAFVNSVLDTLNEKDVFFRSFNVIKGVGLYKQGKYNEAVEILDSEFNKAPLIQTYFHHYLIESKQALLSRQK